MNEFMNELLFSPALRSALFVALQVAVGGVGICLIVLLAARLWERHSAPLAYGVLMAGVVGLLFIGPLIGVGHAVPTLLDWQPIPQEAEILKVPAESLPELLKRPPNERAPQEADMPLEVIMGGTVSLVWALGAVLLFCRLAGGVVKQRCVLIGQPWHADFWTDSTKGRLARNLGLKAFPQVHVSPVAPMPMVLGMWRPRIILPSAAPSHWAQPQWEAVLLHEAAHIARRDPWALAAQRLAMLLFWWCPLVYLVGRRLSALRESICDDYALQGSCDALAYAEVLVESAERLLNLKSVPVAIALLNSAHGGLEARVTRLLTKERKPMTKLSMIGRLGAGLLVGACLLTTAATAISAGQPTAPKKIQIKIIVDGKEIDLGDPRLWEYVEKASKQNTTTKVLTDALVPTPSGIHLDYNVILYDAAKPGEQPRVVLFDAAGKGAAHQPQIVLFDRADKRPGQQAHILLFDKKEGALKITPDDPRIEQLIKAAEAIKPGSSAAIRKALEATRKVKVKKLNGQLDLHFEVVDKLHKAVEVAPKQGAKADAGVNVIIRKPDRKHIEATVKLAEKNNASNWTHELEKAIGKQVVILTTKDGTVVLQLSEADLKKLLGTAGKTHATTKPTKPLDQAIELYLNRVNKGDGKTWSNVVVKGVADQAIIRHVAAQDLKALDKADLEKIIRHVHLNVTGKPGATDKVEAVYRSKLDAGTDTPAASAKEIERLRARIEQLAAEIKALSQRLNERKK